VAATAEALGVIEWADCWVPTAPLAPDVAAEVRRQVGFVPQWAHRLGPVPWMVRGFTALNHVRVAHMPLRLWPLVALVVSRDNACRYCYGVTRTLLKVLGHDDAFIDALEREVHLGQLAPAEQAALEFARRISRADPRPTAREIAALRDAGFSRPAIAEIAFDAAATVASNRLSTLLALPSERFVGWADHPVLRLVRPLVAPFVRVRRAAPVPLPQPNDGPCAAVVAALDGSPAAHVLRQTIDLAMASPILPRRTKLLVLAVVGRALGCRHAEAEARDALAAEGLDGATIGRILADLGSPALDARDALVVPFARETVRYQTAAIQQRTRALAAALPLPEALEVVGIASLANAVCRLSVLLDAC